MSDNTGECKCCDKLADEIERLRGLLRELRDYQADVWNPVYWRPLIDAALADQPPAAKCICDVHPWCPIHGDPTLTDKSGEVA